MKLPQRLLQFGTLAFFSSMIGSLVLYRSGFFETTQALPTWLSEVKQDSLQPPWFDSVQFKQVLLETTRERVSSEWLLMSGSKSAPPAPPPAPKKGKGKRKSAAMHEVGIENATHYDSLIALDILRTRYEVAHLSKQEAREFKRIFSDFQKGHRGYDGYLTLPIYGDSSLVLARLQYGPQHLPQLSEQEKARFKVVLDSLTRPRMMSSKTGLIFLSTFDTTQAIKIVKAEQHPK